MREKNDYIQLPPMKKDTSADVVSFIWEYMKLPEEVREKVKSEMDEIREHCRDSDFQRPNLYDIASAEEVAGLEMSMQKIIADIITEASGIACWVYVEKYVHHKSLQEMLGERKDADKFIFAVDTWFEKILGTKKNCDKIKKASSSLLLILLYRKDRLRRSLELKKARTEAGTTSRR